jgi:hypothetical protein
MIQFQIPASDFLTTTTNAFYHVPYMGMGSTGNPNYLNDLKNTYDSFPQHKLQSAVNELLNVLNQDLPQIYQLLGFDILTICVVPRAKAENAYKNNQQLFRKTVQASIDQKHGFADGINYIRRCTNTYTTHLGERAPNYINDGPEPYPGITEQTCDISADAAGKNILLIDDIYTPGVNIDEDAINALLNAGAKTITFYAVGKVQRN